MGQRASLKMHEFTNIEVFDEEFEALRKFSLPDLLYSAVERSPKQYTVAITYLDLDKLLSDDSQFVDQLFSKGPNRAAPLALWICSWDNSVSLERAIGYLSALKQKLVDNKFAFHFVLPNPYIIAEKARLSAISIESFLQKFIELADCETQPIEADETAYQLLRRVMSLGVRTNVVLDVSVLEDPLHVAKGPEMDIDDDLVLNRICNSAFELKYALKDYSELYSVQTFSFSSQAKQTLSSPFAVPLLRLLCFLRHIFPTPVQLSSSPGLLGKHLYLLINELGICSRREGALEIDSAKSLNLPLLSEISRFHNYAI